MNPHRRFVDIGAALAWEAKAFGHELVAWYAADKSRTERSGIWGGELDPVRIGISKAGEYAVAKLFGRDPARAVKRDTSKGPDKGSDVRCSPTLRADVKATAAGKLYAVWSLAVNDLYWEKVFDVLIACSVDDKDWSRCWVEGWLSKKAFFEKKLVADGKNDEGRLTPGTWFLPKDAFEDIAILLRSVQRGSRFVGFCHCGAPGLYVDRGWWCNDHRHEMPYLRATP